MKTVEQMEKENKFMFKVASAIIVIVGVGCYICGFIVGKTN